MDAEATWFICRIGLVETLRAVTMALGPKTVQAAQDDWARFEVVEIDDALCRHAVGLTERHGLRTLDALHLAAALLVLAPGSAIATWDRRLHAASIAEGLSTLPPSIDQRPHPEAR